MTNKNETLNLFSQNETNLYDIMTLNTEIFDDEIKQSEDMSDLTPLNQEKKEEQENQEIKDDIYLHENNDEVIENDEAIEKSLLEEDFNQTPIKDIKKDIEKYSKIFENEDNYGKVKIMAIGIGGCGCNAISRMETEGFNNIELIAFDTSSQSLEKTKANKKLLIGKNLLKGHGSGNDPEKAQEAFLESKEEIIEIIKDIDMIFLAGGIGLGTGSAGLVEVGKITRELGILTIGFATLPKVIEADMQIVQKYYELFKDSVDSNVIIENEKVNKVAKNLPIFQAMKLADKMLIDGIRGISDLIINPGKINLDYADIKTAFSNQGSCIMGIGYGKGESLVVKAIEDSINSKLINFEALSSANTIIFNITCSEKSITIKEAEEGTKLIYSKNSKKDIQHMLFGYSYDDTLEDEVKVTFIATGTESINFDEYKSQTTNDFFTTGNNTESLFTSIEGDGFDTNTPDFF